MAPIVITGQAQKRLTAQGARYKEKQSMPYDVQPHTVYLGPCTVCGAARGDYEAKGEAPQKRKRPQGPPSSTILGRIRSARKVSPRLLSLSQAPVLFHLTARAC
jgi:hypothetical protein